MNSALFLLVLLKSMSLLTCLRLAADNCSHSFVSSIAAYSLKSCLKMKTLAEWSFTQPSLLKNFKLDSIQDNYVRRVPQVIFSAVKPTPLESNLQVVSTSDDCLTDILDLDPNVAKDELFPHFMSGNKLLPGSDPLAHRYGGYQFGYWADQLGDGRAILLGEYVNQKGQRWELQLKGAGKTPYSRLGDGRAVLRSSIREFLCSEAMNALGIPTSRAASLIVSDDRVIRDQFYNGRQKYERAAVVLRIAPSWFRIGSLEILKMGHEMDNLKQVTDFLIENSYPNVKKENYVEFYRTVVDQSAFLVAKWMAVGFAHGVLNTDNMSLLSITIDYGPFGFLDIFDPHFIPNHSDDEGRYSYNNQPAIFKWNLNRLADALNPLVSDDEASIMEDILEEFKPSYQRYYLDEFRRKLGFQKPVEGDEKLIQQLLDMMESRRTDFSQTFRQLSQIELNETDYSSHWALDSLSKHRYFDEFMMKYRQLLSESKTSDDQRRAVMNVTNPQYVLRNWMAEAAIRQAEMDDFHLTNVLLRILRNPFQLDPEAESYGFSKPPPSWSKSLCVSCSS